MSHLRKLALYGLSLAALCLLAASAAAELAQKGTLRVSVAADLNPNRLPRGERNPVAVSIASRLTTTDRSVPPPLKSLRIELNRHGRLDTAGLPECPLSRIQPASTARALAACRPALVGRGHFSVEAVLGGQQPYPTGGQMLLFNGRYRGRPALLGQIYVAHPFANSFVIPFRIEHLAHGSFGISLSGTFPPAFTSWGHITALRLHLARRYRYQGRRHSFISAGCPTPRGIQVARFPLARTRFSFAGGKSFDQTLDSTCRVARGS